MGVPYLFYYYFKKYKREKELLVTLTDIKNVEYLFLDYNSLIHPAAHQVISVYNGTDSIDKLEEDIIDNCISYTKLITGIVNPAKLYIMIDGVAPRSKMNQQRERRYKSRFFKDIEKKSDVWDSNKITPGTLFMEKISKKLKDTFTDAIVSDSNEAGEGEHKIMHILNEKQINGKIAIYGLDADLIMLSLLHKYNEKIVLIRDTEFGKVDSINYLDINELKKLIFSDFKQMYKNTKKQNYIFNETQFLNDYTFICFLLGNDFLDKLFCLSIKNHGIDIILKSYIKASNDKLLINKELVFDEWLNINLLKDIFYSLKYYEQQCLNLNRKPLITKGISYETIEEYNSESTLYFFNTLYKPNNQTFKKHYYEFYRLNNIKDVCHAYIKGLYWVLGYYHSHQHNNWDWYYDYHGPPFCDDIFNYLNRNKNLKIHFQQTQPFTQQKQLLLVLPRESYINNVDKTSVFIHNKVFFPDKLVVDLNYKEYLWQSKILFEHINQDLLDMI